MYVVEQITKIRVFTYFLSNKLFVHEGLKSVMLCENLSLSIFMPLLIFYPGLW